MGRRKKKNRLPPFVYFTKEMIRSDAFKELTNASRTALLLLRCQCCSNDQTEVKLPYSQAKEYMKTNTFARAIRQLIEMGFIEKEQEGGLFRRTNIYTFSDQWRAYKKPVHMAEYRKATEMGSIGNGKKKQTATEMGSVGK